MPRSLESFERMYPGHTLGRPEMDGRVLLTTLQKEANLASQVAKLKKKLRENQ